MLIHFRNLFWHHHHNNHKPKILHLSSLTVLVILVVVFQVALTLFTRLKPGVLGFAAHISADEVVALTNQQRQTQGLPPLQSNSLLTQAAAAKAAYMFAKNFWAHNAPDGTTPWFFFNQIGYNYRYAGENLARDFGDSGSVIGAWMNSSTHRDNILSDHYNEIGVAVVNGILGGQETTLVVQMFGQRTAAVASVPQTAAVAVAETKGSKTQAEMAFSQPQPQKASLSQPVWQWPETMLTQVGGEYSEKFPLLSVFTLTKSLNLGLAILVMIVLAIDGWLVWHRQTVRISGKSFVHLSFLALVVLLIILSGSGQIM